MRKLAVLLAFLAASAVVGKAQSSLLLGDSTTYSHVDQTTPQQARAFQYTATASGTLNSLVVYIDGTAPANQLIVGLYSDSSNHPASLLASGQVHMVNGAWNTLSVTGVAVTINTAYWIAVLGPQPRKNIVFRDSTAN